MEWIDIMDTVVKIGLGAAISGITTYKLTKLNHEQEDEKEKRTLKISSCEEAISNAEKYFNNFSLLLAFISGVSRKYPDLTKFNHEDSVHQKIFTEIKDYDFTFTSSRPHFSNAVSRLVILGLDDALETLQEIQKIESKIRRAVMFDHELPSSDSLSEWKDNYSGLKKQFFSSISDVYNLKG